MQQGLLIDMDGVIYNGESLIQGADTFIANLIKNDIPFTFMTNNSQRTSLEVTRKLKRLGIEVTKEHVYTSAMATGKFLGDQGQSGTAFVLAFGVACFGAVFAAMGAGLFEEWGGEGGRPVEGAKCDDSGNARFSRGFLNIA